MIVDAKLRLVALGMLIAVALMGAVVPREPTAAAAEGDGTAESFLCSTPAAEAPAAAQNAPAASAILDPEQALVCSAAQLPAGAATDSQAAQAAAIKAYLPLVRGGTGSGPAPARTDSALVSGYLVRGPQPDYAIVAYKPRQFTAGLDIDLTDTTVRLDNAGSYDGWDVLIPPGRGINTVIGMDDWLTVTLNRPAEVAIVWRGGTPLPAWLAGWTPAGEVTVDGDRFPTYRRSVAAGDLTLGAVYDPGPTRSISRRHYLVLVGEQGGRPSPAPAVPAGREAPRANATCPDWVHDQYVAPGPDGRSYPTWHPTIDPVYWCYFHHEHGSDPGIYKPLFGYVSAQAGMDEPHAGFKVYTFRAQNDTTLIVTHHFGTGNSARAACVRFHSFEVGAVRAGTVVASVTLMADHGKATHARSGQALTPSACPDQAALADADGSNGVRMFQVASLEPVGYEPWRLDLARTVLGIRGSFTANTPSRITDCDTIHCSQNVATGDQGEFRFASYTPGFGIRAGTLSGTFYTDAYGRGEVASGTPGAVKQYIAPGIAVSLPDITDQDECYATHPFGGLYACQPDALLSQDQNLEGSIRSPN